MELLYANRQKYITCLLQDITEIWKLPKNLVCQNYEDEKLSLTLYTGDSETSTLANIEEPDEMPHKVVFHQGLLCLQRQKQSLEKEIHFIWKL